MKPVLRNLDIIYVGTLPPHRGGSAINGGRFLPAIAALGHSVRAIAPATAESIRKGDAFAAAHPELRVTRILVPYNRDSPDIPASPEYRESESRQMEALLPEAIALRRPDVILIGRESFAQAVVPIAARHSLPCVLRISGTELQAVARAKQGLDVCREFRRLLAEVEVVLSQSPHVGLLLEALGRRETRIVPNSVDLERFFPRPKSAALLSELGIPQNARIVVHASNMKAVKRPLDIVRSAEATLREERDLFYVIVGDGSLLGEMRQLCREKGLSERFRFTGWVEYDRMPGLINLADLVVMPSETEQQSGVYLETQACARVLLASNIPGARQVIEDGHTGILFRMGDIEDLTQKTLMAVGDANLRREIGAKSQQRVQPHGVHEIAKAHVAALREAADRR